MKKISSIFPILLAACFVVVFQSCVKDNINTEITYYTDDEENILAERLDLPDLPYEYSFDIPNFLGIGRSVAVDRAEATLGRVLFYDTNLSKDNTVSCASCHLQENSFADPKALSDGIEGKKTSRNSLAIGVFVSFSGYYGGSLNPGLFWDESAPDVASQVHASLQSENEMGMNLTVLTSKLAEQDYYKILFKKAYGDETVNMDRISGAITAFVNSINSSDSKFDAAHEQLGSFNIDPYTNFLDYTESENRGKNLFMDNCASCHATTMSPALVNSLNVARVTKACNGLDETYEDRGVGAVSGQSYDDGIFKVPSLRNATLTGPYMHDGRFETLEDVVEHYSSGIQNSANLDPLLKENGSAMQMNFSDTEKADLVAFLGTLTGQKVTEDVKFSNPFK